MSVAKATNKLIDRFGAGGLTLFASVLDLPAVAPWADGQLDDGRQFYLSGRHTLGTSDAAQEAVDMVIAHLKRGVVSGGVVAVDLLPMASIALAETVDADRCWVEEAPGHGGHQHDEVCGWGGRGSGKTVTAGAALAVMGEMHVRAGFAPPLRCLWVHSSLRDAAQKTARSLEASLWGGAWRIEHDRTLAIFSVGGVDLVHADFLAAQDSSAQERLRSEGHVVFVEEPIASLEEGGVPEDRYALALTSTRGRLPGRRRVSLLTTNPGSPTSWVYQRFMAPGHPSRCVAVHVSNRERLSATQLHEMAEDFSDTTADVRARLVFEEWSDLSLGPTVAQGYDPAIHVAGARLTLHADQDITIGWDSGSNSHISAAVVGQRNGSTLGIFGAFFVENNTLGALVDQVERWLDERAPWLTMEKAREYLRHAVDPSMMNWEGTDVQQLPAMYLRKRLGGRPIPGAVRWRDRLAPLLGTLSRTATVRLLIDPAPETKALCRALASQWHYDVPKGGGDIERDAPAKNERPYADLGDALAYLVAAATPSKPQRDRERQHQRSYDTTYNPLHRIGAPRAQTGRPEGSTP